jgi:iron complex transport system permease protein
MIATRGYLLPLAILVVGVILAALGTGATGLSPLRLAEGLQGGLTAQERIVLWDIRLPRLLLGLLVGGGLAVSGVLMQALFRNPLADPGVIGVGPGAALGAVIGIVLGGSGPWVVMVAAFFGGWGAVALLTRIARHGGRTDIARLLLAGVALSALAGAITGLLVTMANDTQLRDLSYWSMGSLGGATRQRVLLAALIILPVLLLAPRLSGGLNALSLGETAAFHMGHRVERLKQIAIVMTALATGSAVALAGGIGFVGIVVPHLLRLAVGPDHRLVLPLSAILGGALLVLADVLARILTAPAELPIGILTALIGAPVFLQILLRRAA